MSLSSGNQGASSSGGESSSSSLRPKGNKSGGSRSGTSSRATSSRLGLNGNPLDRLCEQVLNWKIMDDVSQNICPKSYDWLQDQNVTNPVSVLPDVYDSYGAYVNAWEPLMIKEVQDSLISKFPTLMNTTVYGTFHCTVLPDRGTDPPTIRLECSFNHDQRNGDGGRRTASTMDLLMITLSPFRMPTPDRNKQAPSVSNNPYSAESIDAFKAQKHILGLIVSNSNGGNGPRTSQVLVSKQQWDGLKQHFQEEHVSTYKSVPKGSNSGARLSNNLVGKIKSYKLHYAVIDSLRSNWREFQALHDLGLNIPLMAEILGSARTFVMAATPPYSEPEEGSGEEGNPFVLSPPLESQDVVNENVNTSSCTSSSAATTSLVTANTAEVRSVSSSSSNTNSNAPLQQRKQNRLEIIDQVINSWRMKGCTERFMHYLRLKYNPSQLHAIHTAVDQQGFTLVQGPPGTGKTSTILGILNAIHIREYNSYYKHALEALLGPEGQACRLQPYEHPWLKLISRLTAIKPRILVVAPSNTAVDNIILRIMESGFVDGNGGKYYPNILRVGAGSKAPKIHAVTLEMLVEKELSGNNASTNRREAIDQLSTQVTEMIKKLAFLQSMLVNLGLAYGQITLPDAFELRVDAASGAPLWVDHHLRATSTTPPDRKTLEKRGASRVYTSIELLPDYIAYSHQLTQLLGAIEHANAKRSKLHALDTMTTEIGASNVRELAERATIDSAHILFTTLNSAGHPSMEATEFCVTVVDEAAQSVEPSVLIALRRGCRQCIMVGDQQQLTATVFSTAARAAMYDRSLFQRLIETGHPYIMLDTQYRMCREISAFPSKVFYKGQLKDGENVAAPTYLPAYLVSKLSSTAQIASNTSLAHSCTQNFDSRGASPAPTAVFAPLMFFDLQSSHETQGPTGSQSNPQEAQFCVSLIQALLQSATECKCATLGTVGVITFYSDQLQLLRRTMAKHSFPIRSANAAPVEGTCTLQDLELNTVDGFQGKETDIIIISAVRANEKRLVGFLSDLRRMNVGLTRARKALFVVGHLPTLRSNATWRGLIDHVVNLDAVVRVPNAQVDLLNLLKYRIGDTAARELPNSSFTDALSRYQHGTQGNNSSASAAPSVSVPNAARTRPNKDRDYSQPRAPTQSNIANPTTVNNHGASRVESTSIHMNTNVHKMNSKTAGDTGPATLVPIGSNIVVSNEVVGWVSSDTPRAPPPLAPHNPYVPQMHASNAPPHTKLAIDGREGPQSSLPPPRAFRPPPPMPPSNLSSRASSAGSTGSLSSGNYARSTPSPSTNTSVSNISAPVVDLTRNNKRKAEVLEADVEEGEVVDLT